MTYRAEIFCAENNKSRLAEKIATESETKEGTLIAGEPQSGSYAKLLPERTRSGCARS